MEFTWCFLVVLIPMVTVGATTVINFVNKACDQSNSITQTFGRSLQDCRNECDQRTSCKAIMFRPGMGHCSMKENIDISSLSDVGHLCLYLKKTDWVAGRELGPCGKNDCGDTEKCSTSAIDPGKVICLKSECLHPDSIPNAYLQSKSNKRSIGAVNRYKCVSGYTGFGSPSITCKADANWSTTNFHCRKNCKIRKTNYYGASFAERGKKMVADGSTLHFICGMNFQGDGSFSSSVCKNGSWDPNRVLCCDNGTERWPWWHRCLKYTGLVSSEGHAHNICSSLGYQRTGVSEDNAKAIIERYSGDNDGVAMLTSQTKTFLLRVVNFTECLVSNGFKNASQYQNLTFDERVKFSVSENLTDSSCSWYIDWAEGEPNGGDIENCIIRSKATNYRLADINCDNFQGKNVSAVCHKDLPGI